MKETLGSAGQPLGSEERSYFEPRFGFDFGRVRVHADTRAAESAEGLAARAYTVGNHVAFGAGQFSPETREGRRLLGHELAHVMQQRVFASAEVWVGPVTVQRKKLPGADGTAPPDAAEPQPRSLTEVLDPDQLGRDELREEIALVRAWLAKNGTVYGPSLARMSVAFKSLQAEQTWRTQLKEAKTPQARAQLQSQHRVRKLSNEQLSDKIVKTRADMFVHYGWKLASIPEGNLRSLDRLDKEQARRRNLPVTSPATVAQAIEMMKEAWRAGRRKKTRPTRSGLWPWWRASMSGYSASQRRACFPRR